MSVPRPQYASTSLYVGDLSPDVAETTLYEFFNSVGPVASIRVCRDSSTRRSLGYAYVNYHNITDAERALDTLNFTTIKNRPCRIMWSQRDPTVRKNGAGNLFVKNLDKTVDNRALHDTFSLFGNILSCKVVTDENGKSKGYGFVHFESDEAAANAIERVNGMKIGSKEVFVGPFHKRNERPSGKPEHFTNIYVRSFPKSWTDETLHSVFQSFGEITSLWRSSDKQGRPFACINYQDGAHAKQAVQSLNGRKVNAEGLIDESAVSQQQQQQPAAATTTENNEEETSKRTDTAENGAAPPPPSAQEVYTLFVDRAQDKAERGFNIKNKFDNRQQQYRQKFEGVNLYIKNLADNVDDAELRQMFEKFGTITSVKVMKDEDGHSKGFGFVCFTTAEEATKAISEMHLKVHDSKPLYVGLAEQKERRHARLQSHFRGSTRPNANQNQMAFSQPNNMFFQGPTGMMPPPTHAQHASGPLVWPGPTPFQQPPTNIMWKTTPPMFGGPNVMAPMGPNGALPPHMMFPPTGQAAPYRAQQQPPRQMLRPELGGHPQPVRGAPPSAATAPQQPSNVHKQVLGERLFPLVSKHQPQLAGKITGMMLDMDEHELVMLIQSETELKAKIDEALRVLEQAQLG